MTIPIGLPPIQPQDAQPVPPAPRVVRAVRLVPRNPSDAALPARVLLVNQSEDGCAARGYVIAKSLNADKQQPVGTIVLSTYKACPIELVPEVDGVYKVCGPPVVIKVYNTRNPDLKRQATNEVVALRRVSREAGDCRHVVGLVEVLEDPEETYIVVPFVPGGDLYDLLRDRTRLSVEEALMFFAQVLEGLRVLKKHNIAHGDISLENVMLRADKASAVLIDFGSASVLLPSPGHGTGYTPDASSDAAARGVRAPVGHDSVDSGVLYDYKYVGKLSYAPPEVAYQHRYSAPVDPFQVDMWQCGVLLFTLLTGAPLYTSGVYEDKDPFFKVLAAGNAQGLIAYVCKILDVELEEEVVQLLCGMLRADPTQRSTLEQLLSHPLVRRYGGGGGGSGGFVQRGEREGWCSAGSPNGGGGGVEKECGRGGGCRRVRGGQEQQQQQQPGAAAAWGQ